MKMKAPASHGFPHTDRGIGTPIRKAHAGSWLMRACRVLGLLALAGTGAAAHQACRPFQYGERPVMRLEGVHDCGTTALAFDPAGRRLASAGYWGEIRIWSVPSGEARALLKAHRKPVRGLSWASEARLVSGAEDGRLILWDPEAPQPKKVLKTGAPITALAVLNRPHRVITGHEDGWIRSFSLPHLQPVTAYDMGAALLSVAVDGKKGRIAASAEGGRVALLSPHLTLIRDLESSPRNAFEIRFAPNGRQLAGGAWYKLLLWDLESGRLQMKDTEHWGKVVSVDYSPEGKSLASIGRVTDSKVRILNVKSGRVARRLEAHQLCGMAVRFSPDGRYLASGSDDESVRIYDLSEGDR
jgi:WD40 repeat protein